MSIRDLLEAGCLSFLLLALFLFFVVGAIGYYLGGWTGVWVAEGLMLMVCALGAIEGMRS